MLCHRRGGVLSAWKKFWRRQSLASASLLISVLALWFTFYNAHLDRSFKELSIKPQLQIDANTVAFQVSVANKGVGPAQIKRIATKFGQSCKFLTFDSPDAATAFVDAVHGIGDWYIDPLDQLIQRSVWEPTRRKLIVQPLTPNEIISAGESLVMFQLDRDQLEAAQQKYQSMDTETFNKITERFIERVRTMPYYPEYCSLTGKYCKGAEQIRQKCK